MIDNDTKINEINKHELVNGKLWHFCPESNVNIIDPAQVLINPVTHATDIIAPIEKT